MSPNDRSAVKRPRLERRSSVGPHTAALNPHGRSSSPTSNSHLPVELISFILEFRFPYAYLWRDEMAEIYGLRGVSKLWKELIEGTPRFWTRISTDYPTTVIRDCLRLSKNHLLHVYHSQTFFDPITSSIEKLQLLQLHAHRWEKLYFYTDYAGDVQDQRIRDFLESPAPRLQSISARFKADPLPMVNLAGGQAKQLKYLDLRNAPVPWSSLLLIGLETFSLMLPSPPPEEELVDIFVKSPCLRRFDLSYRGIGGQEGTVVPATPNSQPSHVIAASLEKVTLTLDHSQLANHILSHVSMPACRSLVLKGEFDDIHFLDGAFAHFLPKIGDALRLSGRTTLYVLPDGEYQWGTSSEQDSFQISLELSRLPLEGFIESLRNLAIAAETQLELEVSLATTDRWTVDALSEWSEVTRLEVTSPMYTPSYEPTERASFPDYLAQTRTHPEHGLSWTFPNLQELDISYLECTPTQVFGALNGRYLHTSHLQAMEDLGVSISTPPKLDIWMQDGMQYEDTAIVTVLENHWGLESLNWIYREKYR